MNFSCVRSMAGAAVAVGAVSVAMAGSASAATTGSSAWRSETLHVLFAHEQCKMQNVSKSGKPALGAEDICRYDILNTAKKKIGHAGFACGLISDDEGVCDGTMVLPGGTLAIAGDMVDGHQIAISGGTGRYEGAVGEWSYDSSTPAKVTVHLLIPRV